MARPPAAGGGLADPGIIGRPTAPDNGHAQKGLSA